MGATVVMSDFKPFEILDVKRFRIDPKANIYPTIKKVLRLKKNKDYEIEINVREKDVAMKFVCDVCNERCTVTEGKAPQVCLATGGNEAKWREIPDVYITVNDNWDIILDRRKIGTLEWNPTFLMDEDNDIVLTYVRDDDYDAEVPVHRCKWKLGSDKCTTCGKDAEMAIAEDSKFRNIRPGGR